MIWIYTVCKCIEDIKQARNTVELCFFFCFLFFFQLRYVSHTARLMPGSSLSEEFRGRLRQIAAHMRLNRTASAWYESQLIVRDYGTHVVTSVDIGAALTQVCFLHSIL